MDFDLIVFATDNTLYKFNFNQEEESSINDCKLAPVLCGLAGVGRKYPDLGLPMGYPFDRFPHRDWANRTFEELAELVPNMFVRKVTIYHENSPELFSEDEKVDNWWKINDIRATNEHIKSQHREADERRRMVETRSGGWGDLSRDPGAYPPPTDYKQPCIAIGKNGKSKWTFPPNSSKPIPTPPPSSPPATETHSSTWTNPCCQNYQRYGRDGWCCFGNNYAGYGYNNNNMGWVTPSLEMQWALKLETSSSSKLVYIYCLSPLI